MFDASVRIRKEFVKYNFDNGDVMEGNGIRIIIAPKIEKFILLENLTSGKKSNLELVEYCNPNLAQWYHNSPVGSELTLKEVSTKKVEIRDIYTNTENSL